MDGECVDHNTSNGGGLLDLIALAWPNHVHHAAAWAWFEAHQQEGWQPAH